MKSRTIFIAYSHKDTIWKDRIARQLRVLKVASPDIEIWDDRRISAGREWLKEIEKAIARAHVAVLLVSDHFLTSRFIMRREVPRLLRKRTKDGLTVIPVIVRACAWETVPWLKRLSARPHDGRPLVALRHKADQALADLATETKGVLNSDCPKALAASPPSPILPASGRIHPPQHFPVGGGLRLPCFFPSVSGAAKNLWTPLQHLQVLVRVGYPCFLVSAYDLASAKRPSRMDMETLLRTAMKKAQIVLLDSGLYERKWLHDTTWSKLKFSLTLSSTPCTMSFSFDVVGQTSRTTSARQIASQVRADRRKSDLAAIFPIVHGEPKHLPQLVKQVVHLLDCDIVAVAERELGDGILAGARTMLAIRRALDETGRYCCVHVLGTGNPLSLLIYSACGADSFDGLDWCQTVADFDSKRLYHSQQLDFFAEQSTYAQNADLTYSARMLAHNLEFYRNWMVELQDRRSKGTTAELMSDLLPRQFRDRLLPLLDHGRIER